MDNCLDYNFIPPGSPEYWAYEAEELSDIACSEELEELYHREECDDDNCSACADYSEGDDEKHYD